MLGIQGTLTESLDSVHVDHFGQILIIPDLDLLQFMAGAETVEEVQERNSALNGSQVGNRREIHHFLHAAFGQHRKTGLAAGHDVRVVAEDVQCVAGKRTGADMEDTGKQFTGDLVHVRDHQQQALGSRIGGGQGTGVQRAVHGAGSAGLSLHFLHLDGASENILPAGGGPLVNVVCHRAGGRDGIDCRNFVSACLLLNSNSNRFLLGLLKARCKTTYSLPFFLQNVNSLKA